ncbi:MAG: type II toxin-antitoxin system RelE/ParE family toxin [Maricaulaceae bacterium]|nr:type II toxin-antitoxin system RelE/ParE family toxin [Maricaulaceae bacterium]
MIRSWACKDTKAFFETGRVPKQAGWASCASVAARKLVALAAARTLNDLRSPPGNRLEALKGGRAGQHSIRISDQWRVCFEWTPDGPEGVEITDYH